VHVAFKRKGLKNTELFPENTSRSYGAPRAIWDLTEKYLLHDTGEGAPLQRYAIC